MNTMYWNLFWTTGMPEAWLMSREKEGTVPPMIWQGGIQGTGVPDAPVPLTGSAPGGLRNIY